MILLDTPRTTTFRRFKRTAHCASTLPGEQGTRELEVFGSQIGMRKEWMQYEGQPREHYDLFDAKIERALQAGAEQVANREFIKRVVWPKRAATRE